MSSSRSYEEGAITFSAQLVAEGEGDAWTFLYLPQDASAALGTRGMVAVKGTINGYTFRTSAQPSGKGTHMLTVNKQLQAGAGAKPGDTVRVVLELDTERHQVVVPVDLARALRSSMDASRMWDQITPRAREEWIGWVESAKKEETRARRVGAVVERLAAGKRRVHD